MRTTKVTNNQLKNVARLLTKYSNKHGKDQSIRDAVNVVVTAIESDVNTVVATDPA